MCQPDKPSRELGDEDKTLLRNRAMAVWRFAIEKDRIAAPSKECVERILSNIAAALGVTKALDMRRETILNIIYTGRTNYESEWI